jgi:hypothetical protein
MPFVFQWVRRPFLLLVASVVAVLMLIPASARAQTPQFGPIPDDDESVVRSVQLSNSALLPDLRTLSPHDIELQVIEDRGIVRLRFSNTIWNSGPGDLELRGSLIPGYDSVLVVQAMKSPDGRALLEEAGKFSYHEEHGHWHWEGFSIYQVWSLDPHGRPQTVVASSDKVGYCLIDVRLYKGPGQEEQNPPEYRQYGDCNWYLQGLSSGWTDTYQAHIAGQFVDITGLPDGTYALVSTVDPDNIILETNNRNNSALIYFKLSQGVLEIVGDRFLPNESDLPFQ